MHRMNGLRGWLSAVSAMLLLPGCAHDPSPRASVAEERIVMAPAPADAKPLPEIDPSKPLAHANDLHQRTCWASRRSGTVCR